MPVLELDQRQTEELLGLPRNKCTAELLNLLFDANLTGWDLDYCLGRSPVRTLGIGQKIIAGECWRNFEGRFSADRMRLAKLLEAETDEGWVKIGIGCAVLGGMLAQLWQSEMAELRRGVDLAILAGDLSMVMSAWYLKQWGFPIRGILACCNENSGLWDLLYQGMLRTDALARTTDTPAGDQTVPAELERLIYHCGGISAAAALLERQTVGRAYCPDADVLKTLRETLSAAVVSGERMENAISGLYGTNGYVLSPESAVAYAGLLDHRAGTGEYRPAMLIAQYSPETALAVVSRILRMTEDQLKTRIL